MRQHQVHALLTPDPADAPAPEGFAEARVALTRGLPAPLELPGGGGGGGGVTLLLTAPTARIRTWLGAAADLPAAASAPQLAPFPTGPRGDDPRARLHPTLIAARGRTPFAATPLVVGARILLPRAGERAGPALEILIRAFALTAASMRGPGGEGASVTLAWRRIEGGSAAFSAPEARPSLLARHAARQDNSVRPEDPGSAAAPDPEAGGLNWRLTHG